MALQPGEIIDGKYRIVRLLGEGGMGAVYEGENTRIRRRVAIKVLHSAVAEKTDVVQRFEREAQAAGRIGSEHIVEVLDLGSLPSGERYMVMEFLDGEDLTSRIKKRKRIRPQEAIPLMHQVLEGLSAAHDAGIVHRDLKPDNIYILNSRAGRADFVKILDFGVSKFSTIDPDMAQTRAGSVMGTPYYMAPEQAKGGEIDARTDLYALGVVLYQMTTGRVPFNAGSFNELLFKIALETPEPVERLVPDISPPFAAIIRRAMAREAELRFQSARQFQEALAQWQLQAPPAQAGMSYSDLPGGMPSMPTPADGRYSNPGMMAGVPGSMGGPQGVMGDYIIPGTATPIPGSTPSQGMLTPAHAALAISQTRGKRRNAAVALVVVGVAILGVGGIGAWLLLTPPRQGSGQAATPTAVTAATAAPTASASATATAAADATSDATASPAASDTATEVATAEPVPSTPNVPQVGGARAPAGAGAAKSKATATPTATATAAPATTASAKGRAISTEL
jgi:serine/threonine protein kinase